MLWMTIILAIILVIISIWLTFWSRQGLSGPSPLEFGRRMDMQLTKYYLALSKKYGKFYASVGLPNDTLVVNDPELIREIYTRKGDIFLDRIPWSLGLAEKTMPFMPGDHKWKRIRPIITRAFTPGKLKAMTPLINSLSDQLINSLHALNKKDSINIRHFLETFIIDVISCSQFGINTDSMTNQDNALLVAVKGVFDLNSRLFRILAVIIPKLSRLFNISYLNEVAIKNTLALFRQILNAKIGGNKESNLMQIIKDAVQMNKHMDNTDPANKPDQNFKQGSSKDNRYLTEDEAIFIMASVYGGGFETTVSTLCHIIHFICDNKDCQQILYKELKDITDFSYDTLSELKYLNAVINETLRLEPPVVVIPKMNNQDTQLAGVNIPKGTPIEIITYVVHRDPDYWSDPEQFKPERFLEPTHKSYAYIPFGGGPRICIGDKFSINEMRVLISKLVVNFELSVAPGFKLDKQYLNGAIFNDPRAVLVNLKARI